MTAEFVKVFTMQGFDKYAVPNRWQMVPVGGVRYIALRGGTGLTVSSTAPLLKVTEIKQSDLPAGPDKQGLQSGDRIFKLEGSSKGAASVQAKSDANLVVALDVNTKDKKSVILSFNFIHDSANHKTNRSPASAANWVNEMCYIYEGQANIQPTLRATRIVNVPSDLGQEVLWSAGASNEWVTVTALGDAAADMNFFMVWEYEQDATPGIDNTDAGALGGNCIFEDAAGKQVSETMAHEMGHFLGCPDQYVAARKRELMYGYTDTRGAHLSKIDVNIMNP
jgi:hypothetical protein